MVEAELAHGAIGKVGEYEIEFKDKKLVITAKASYAMGSTTVVQEVGAKEVLEALKKAIPGTLDDAVISAAELALGL